MKTWYDEADVNEKIAAAETRIIARVAEALRAGGMKCAKRDGFTFDAKNGACYLAADHLLSPAPEVELPTMEDWKEWLRMPWSTEIGRKTDNLAREVVAGRVKIERVK
jgi:hypothetical protein